MEKIKEMQRMLESEDPKERAVGKGMLVMYMELVNFPSLGYMQVGERYVVTFVSWNRNKTESKLYKRGHKSCNGTPHIKGKVIIFGGVEENGKQPCIVCTMDDGRRWYRIKDLLAIEAC